MRPGLEGLAARADEVADVFDRSQAANQDNALAEAELLAAVMAVVAPALPALSDRVAIRQTTTSLGTTADYASWRGVHIGSFRYLKRDGALEAPGPVPTRHADDPARGTFAGVDLFAAQDGPVGALWELTYAGPWSSVPGEVSRWQAKVAPVDVREACVNYGVGAIVEAISRALDREGTHRREERSGRLRARAERLRAISTLVKASL